MTLDEKVFLAKEKNIVDYLTQRGLQYDRSGDKYFFSSPFSRDSNWSFCVYPSNTFFDFSTGKYGDVIELVKQLEQLDFVNAVNHLVQSDLPKIVINYKKYKDEEPSQPFDYTRFINTNSREIKLINEYAHSRGITEGYYPGIFFTRVDDRWVRNPSLMFVHVNADLVPCGAKFRKINNFEVKDGTNKSRFSARGKHGFYILENVIEDSFEQPSLYLVESETSANSLWMYLRHTNQNAVVISFGGVSSAPKKIPTKYQDYKLKIIIDYDGDETLYKQRLKLYSHLNGEDIKLKLPKGEDLNSLYSNNKINLIQNLI